MSPFGTVAVLTWFDASSAASRNLSKDAKTAWGVMLTQNGSPSPADLITTSPSIASASIGLELVGNGIKGAMLCSGHAAGAHAIQRCLSGAEISTKAILYRPKAFVHFWRPMSRSDIRDQILT